MSNVDLVERAVSILRQNRHLVLATSDAGGSWAAALAYTAFAPNHLYFMSQRSSRHAEAIRKDSRIAGVVYNSLATGEEVDGIQFSGRASEREKDLTEMRRVLGRAAEVAGSPNLTPAEEQEFLTGKDLGLYQLEVEEMYLLDQEAWEERKVDARVAVEVAEVFRRYEERL